MNSQPLGSEYIDVEKLDWQPTMFPGVMIKILWKQEDGDAYTGLFQLAPGARLPMHRHTGVEQTFVLKGTLVDEDGECTAGNFVWRRPGSVHAAHSPDGCLTLGIFHSPNEFLETGNDHGD